MGRDLRRFVAACAAFAATLLPGWASAAPDPGPSVSELTVTASKTVAELTVTARLKCLQPARPDHWAPSPRVVSTFPAKDAVVRPGIVIVRVTFDQPMACAGMFKEDPPLGDPCPGFKHDLLLSYDRMTVRTACVVGPGRRYGALIRKGEDEDDAPFLSLAGARAKEFELRFTTSADPPVTTVCEALAEDEQTARELRQRGRASCAAPPPATGG